MKQLSDMKDELERILVFINNVVGDSEKVVIPVSGGLDSDVVARLCVRALGKDRIRLFIVKQEGLESKYVDNALKLANDTDTKLAVISLGSMNRQLIHELHTAAPYEDFQPDSLLDPARANCSLRTAIISSYQDKGYLIAANSNRTEIELGFFLPFGDNLGHFKPIAHLYKSEVRILAELLQCRREVIDQSPSAGFWEGETDLEDMAYWLYNKGPIPGGRIFTDEDDKKVNTIRSAITQEKIDRCLISLNYGKSERQISREVMLPEFIVTAIRETKDVASKTKNRKLLVALERI